MIMMRTALYQANALCSIFILLVHWKQMALGQTHYTNYDSTSFCSYFLVLCVKQKGSEYQFYSPWFDPTRNQTHDLQQPSRVRSQLHQQSDHSSMCLVARDFKDTNEVIRCVNRKRTDNSMVKRKRTNNDLQIQRSNNTNFLRTWNDLWCSGWIHSCCPSSGTRHVTLFTNPEISYE